MVTGGAPFAQALLVGPNARRLMTCTIAGCWHAPLIDWPRLSVSCVTERFEHAAPDFGRPMHVTPLVWRMITRRLRSITESVA
jgi:hypothetical protein